MQILLDFWYQQIILILLKVQIYTKIDDNILSKVKRSVILK